MRACYSSRWRTSAVRTPQRTRWARGSGTNPASYARGRYGATRCHQLLCLVAMELPIAWDARAVRDEQLKVLQAVAPLTCESVAQCTVRGQLLSEDDSACPPARIHPAPGGRERGPGGAISAPGASLRQRARGGGVCALPDM
ncbi:MAG: hypothetical protein ACREOH_02835 [Candidatus Entotheonellia bacterium]